MKGRIITREKRTLYMVLLLLLTGAYFFHNTYFIIGGFGVGYSYLIAVFIIAVGAWVFLCSPDVARYIRIQRQSWLLAVPFLICLIVTMLIYVFYFTEIRQMISGFFEVVYALIAIFAAGSLIYLLEERVVPCLFWAVVLAYSMMALIQIREVGIGEFFRQFYVLLASGSIETLPAMKAMEAPCFSYSFGMFFLYFSCCRGNKKHLRFLIRISVCTLCLLLGLKRSSLLSLAVGLCAACVFLKIPGSLRKAYFNLFITALILFAVFMIPFVRSGLFTQTAEFFHISVMGRDRIYRYYSDYYEISPFYFGRGLGWVADFLRDLSNSAGNTRMATVHDEYVRSYIEMGFWGYLFWVFSNFLLLPKKTASLRDVNHSAVIIGCTAYLAVMYITENIYFRFTSTLVWAAIIMACSDALNVGDYAV